MNRPLTEECRIILTEIESENNIVVGASKQLEKQ
jgi:hypothetical protein